MNSSQKSNVEIVLPAPKEKCFDINKNDVLIKKTIVVSDSEDGKRLDQILHQRYKNFSRTLWQKRIARREVSVNQLYCRPSRKMNKYDIVVFLYPQPQERDVNRQITTLYEDNYLLVVNKPTNLPVHASGAYQKNNLLDVLKETQSCTLHLVHRLDRETSGALLLAKDKKSAAHLARQFYKHKVYKEYHALLRGHLAASYNADGWIGAQKEKTYLDYQKFRMQVFYENDTFLKKQLAARNIKSKGFDVTLFKKARCQFYALEYFSFADACHARHDITLARVVLHSGRTHQIRATALAIGFPLLGDKLYGGKPCLMQKFVEEKLSPQELDFLRLSHTALHCRALGFIHPHTQKKIFVQSPYAHEFAFFIEQLKYKQ